MKTFATAALLTLGASASHAGEGRVLFVCPAGTTTCELAAQRFEARSRAEGWQLGGRAAFVDDLVEADLALATLVVTIDAALYRRWLLSIRHLEAWDDVPRTEADPTGAAAAIEARLDAMARRRAAEKP